MARRRGGRGGGLLDLAGDALEGFGAALGGTAQGIGSAIGGGLQGLGSAIGGALQGALTEGDKTIVNMGIVGSVGRENVKQKPVPNVPPVPEAEKSIGLQSADEDMPIKKLLSVVINYLQSIDNTLKASAKFDVQLARNEAAAIREQNIESPTLGGDAFGKIGKTVDAKKEESSVSSGFIGGLVRKFALMAAGVGLIGIMSLNQEQIDQLQTNIAQFKNKYGWMVELAAAGGLVAAIARRKYGVLAALGLSMFLSGRDASTVFDENGNPVGDAAPSTFETALTIGVNALLLRGGVRAGARGIRALRRVGGRMRNIRNAPRPAPSLRGTGFRDPRTGRAASRAAVTAGGGWLSGPRGQRFVAFLSRRFGASYVARKLMPLLARVLVGIGITATGIGAIPGAIWTLVNIGLSIYTVYEILDALWDWWSEEQARDDAEAVNQEPPQADASRENAPPGSSLERPRSNITGAPRASEEEIQNLPQIPADIEKILATIRTRESGGNYGENRYKRGSTASGAYQFLDGTWKERARVAGVGTEYERAYQAPPEIQDAVAAKYVQDILAMPAVNGDVSKIPLVWFTGNPEGNISAAGRAANRISPAEYQSRWMQTYAGGQYSESSYDATAGSLMDDVGTITKEGLQTISAVFSKFLDTDTVPSSPGAGATGAAMAPPTPIDMTAELTPQESQRTASLIREQVNLQADEIAGLKRNEDAAAGQAAVDQSRQSSVQSAVRNATGGTIDVMNPNYNIKDGSLLTTYIMFFGVGAGGAK